MRTRTRNRRFRRGALALAAGLAACSGEVEPPAPVVRPVRFVEVSPSSPARERSFSGTAQAGTETRLSFRIGGKLQRLDVSVGDHVAATQPIAEVDPTDLRIQVQDASASLEQARAQAVRAEAAYARVERLWASKTASQSELDEARAQAHSARAQVASVEQKLELANRQLEYSRLLAPREGVVTEVLVEVNQNVSPGQVICVVVSGELLEVRVGVPETYIGQVRRGDPVWVVFDSLPDEKLAATITEVGIAASRASSTYPVTVQLLERDERLLPGMAAQVSFSFDPEDPRPRFHVPPAAVGEDRQGNYVFVVEKHGDGYGTVHRRAVEPGRLTGEAIEVFSGLSDGELVVTAGVNRISDGLRVRVQE